jgi:hypothetical protein
MNYQFEKASLFCFIFIFIYGCRKEIPLPATTVHGTVTNRLTGELVANIPIEVIECDGWPIKCLTTIKTVHTDPSGHYNISFVAEKRKAYRVALGFNDVLGWSPYPYYDFISKNMDNTINYSPLPLKTLQIHFRISRHDKNWLHLGIQACDTLNYFSNDYYYGENPIDGFDTTYTIKVEASRFYAAYVGLSNKIAEYTYEDNEFINKFFTIDNIDSTKIDFIVP